MRRQFSARAKLGLALGASSLASCGLWLAGAWSNHSPEYWYLVRNLLLAWICLGAVLWLRAMLRTRLWSSWQALGVTLLWLFFLPNSFYILSDFVHLGDVPRVDIVLDVAMIASLALNGLILGYLSLYMVHMELRKRLSVRASGVLVTGVLLLSSFAIYIGRDLRWNTWDLLVNPTSLLFDVSDRLLNVQTHPQVFSTTLGFFVLLGSVYLVIAGVVRTLVKPTRQ